MFDDFSDEPVYNVKAIAQQSGIMASTLRAWERRYGIPKPGRAGSGYRLYSSRDIAMIRWLKAQIDSGMSISQAVSLLHSMQQGGRRGNNVVVTATPAQSYANTATYSRDKQMHDQLMAAAVMLDEAGIEAVMSEAFSIHSAEDVCMNVIQPALISIGEQWHRGEVSINVEHFFSNLMRRKLLSLLDACAPPIRQTRIITGCAPEELHEMGILMISLFLRRRGYDVVYLGQSISLDRMEELLQSLRPQAILLSAGTLLAASRLVEVGEYLMQHGPSSIVLAYGGHIFNSLPELRFQIAGHPLSLTTLKAIDALEALFENPINNRANMQMRPREVREAAMALHSSRAALLSDMVEVSQRMLDRNLASDLSEHLLKVLEAAVRLNQPALLEMLSTWEWDTRLQTEMARLRNIVLSLEHAVRRHLNDYAVVLIPYMAALKKATTLDKD